jgi:hypothetical protein
LDEEEGQIASIRWNSVERLRPRGPTAGLGGMADLEVTDYAAAGDKLDFFGKRHQYNTRDLQKAEYDFLPQEQNE